LKTFAGKELAKYIDHTLLKPDATEFDVRRICQEAIENQFFGVCVNSMHIPLVTGVLTGTQVRPVSVIGFPLGAMATVVKAQEAEYALSAGAHEIDMVLPIGWMKERQFGRVEKDIKAVAEICKTHVLKVILETIFLTDEEKRIACELSASAGAHFVKTCTGFAGGGATVTDIAIMRKAVGSKLGVKASGGIKSTAAAIALIEAGANRLGTSSGVSLIQGHATGPGY
jgi:deoxyribose-phosphate aldolase